MITFEKSSVTTYKSLIHIFFQNDIKIGSRIHFSLNFDIVSFNVVCVTFKIMTVNFSMNPVITPNYSALQSV